jgi:hypothetical protein
MPVNLVTTSFLDQWGNTEPAYKSNAGDRITASLIFESSIRVSSVGNSLLLDPSINTITWSGGNFLLEGFRPGDTVVFNIYSASGTVLHSWTTTATLVTQTVLDVNSIPFWYDITTGEIIVIEVPTQAGRGDLQILLNHVSNINGGAEFSLIDGEVTRGIFYDVNNIAVSGTQTATLTGNKSGQYLESMNITRLANVGNARRFKVDAAFLNSGIYDATWFNSSDCLKTLFKIEWGREPGDLTNQIKATFSDTANTGFFNEGHNIDPIDSALIQGISEIDYFNPTTHIIKIDGPITDIGIGASYIPLDDAYYKNKIYSQAVLGMVRYTIGIGIGGAYASQLNPAGAGYSVEINNITTVGSITEIELTFQPNPEFFTFMESRDEGDRLFYFWVKCGNVNHLAYADQLQYTPPAGDPLVIIDAREYYDHAQNVNNDSILNKVKDVFNIEDDCGFFGKFLLEKNKIYDRFSAKIEAFNASTSDNFTLLQVSFDFSGVPISGDGRYLLNESVTVVTTLPNTSLKRDAILILEPSLDTVSEYGVSIYFPFLLRWEYWLTQSNASTDFWPNQNKNWLQYDNTGSWEVRLQLNLEENNLSHLYNTPITIKDYDSEPNLLNTIQLSVESTAQVVPIVVENELMRITATHEILNGLVWDPLDIWGMITVEPKESAARWILSSTVNTDFNVLNPLSPLSGSVINITFPAPNIAKLECYFDPGKINLTNGVKFTSKIKGCPTEPTLNKTTSPDNIIKSTTFGDNKTLA